jgi:Ca-activated chloride channel family protein
MNSNQDSNDANRDADQGCDKFADELTHLVLGELEPERAAAVEAHCASCAACRAERELLAKSAALIEADAPKLATVMRLSEAREQALLAQAAAAPLRKFWTPQRLAAAAAAILAVCVTGNWIWRKYDPTREAADATQFKQEVAMRSNVTGLGSAALPADAHGSEGEAREFVRRLDEAIEAGDRDATKATIEDLQKSGVKLKPAELASLSVDLTQNDDAESALALLQQAPAKDQLDAATAEKLARVTKYAMDNAKTDDDKQALAQQLASLGYLGGEEALEEEAAPIDSAGSGSVGHRGIGKPKAIAGRKAGAAYPRSGTTPLSDADRDALRALGYGDGGEPAFDSRQQIGKVLYTVPLTREEALKQREELEKLGYPAGQIPVPPVGGMGQAQSVLFDDGDASTSWKVFYPTTENDAFTADLDDVTGTTAPIVALVSSTPHDTPHDVALVEDQLRRAVAAGRTVDVDALVKSFLDRLAPRQGEAPRDMFFRWFGDNPAVPTRIDARSTFGMDVDTASYNLARGYLAKGSLPPKAAVRTEEFVNAFKQGLVAPAAAVDGVQNPDVFALTTELAPSPFGEGKQLLRIGLKAREIDRSARAPASLTFVIDVSGSMEEGGRLELVKQALRLLVAQLDERDSIAIVVFSENARIALPPTRASEQATILAALDPLRPENSTNAGAGLRLGYDLAMTQRDRAGDHRVILCSDGVANAGVTDPDQLTARIRQCKSERIYLTTVGVGMNNVNDALLEQLAREGDGNCHYVDGLAEAKELFVDKLTGTLSTVARDAKIQVEFQPESVRAFRQLGYENRAIAHADFRNDKVDAGEVGAGHEVVALYELDLAPDAAGPLATVHCRYEEPRSQTVREQARVCFMADALPTVAAASPRWRLDAAVAEFAELLRQSVHARDGSFGAIERLAEPLVAELADDKDVPEFVALVKQAARLPDLLPRRGELSRCVDELKKVRCWQQELGQTDPAQKQANGDLMRQLEEQNRKLEQALRDALANAAGKR